MFSIKTIHALFAATLAVVIAGCGPMSPNDLEDVAPTGQDLHAAPTLVAPADGATISDGRPLFSWDLKQCQSQVTLQLCADPQCAIIEQSVAASSCTKTQLTDELAPGTYYWRAAQTDETHQMSAWSTIRRFVIAPASPMVSADLFGVWSVNASDVWVVGAAGTILHYNGVWSVEDSKTSADLRSVWAMAGGQGWAVGAAGTILHRDGASWAAMASPTTENLFGVWASGSNSAWAVGNAGLILHFDGISWTISHNRMAGSLRAVWGANANDVWVVGSGKEPIGDYASLLLHWDGTSWFESYVCNPEGTRFASGGWVAVLNDVWGASGGTVWSAGQCNSGASFVPAGYIAQNTGSTGWSDTMGFAAGQPLSDYRPLDAIWSSGASDVWAASGSETVSGAATTPNMLHFDGTTWTTSPQAITVGIYDLGGSASNDVWAVGKAGKRLHYDGTTWTATP